MNNSALLRQAGIDEKSVVRFMAALRDNRVNMHSVLLQRHGKLVFEKYWAPFDAQRTHRMYSVTKSFVSAAIGCLADEGRLDLDAPIVSFFPDKLPEKIHPLLEKQTVRDMLTMRTCFSHGNWFTPEVTDRCRFYFSLTPDKAPGTLFHYDSTGSYILGVLAERVSGRPLLEYMREKFLNKIGGFESAVILETPDGTPWGDSALVCTPRALMNFAQLMLNGGSWNGEQLISADYVRAATACQTDNNLEDGWNHSTWGYGYQFWRTRENSFCCFGMGGQYAVVVPDKDIILVCNADAQLTSEMDCPHIFRSFFDDIVAHLDGCEPGEPEFDLSAPLEIKTARGSASSPRMEELNGVNFRCEPNAMGLECFRLEFDPAKQEGVFRYVNAQGEKELPFGLKKQVYGKFPQLGYSDGRGNVHEITDFKYDCAVSGGWLSESMLQLRVQIIDRYFGILIITLGFRRDGWASVRMTKCAEDFLREYDGWAIARADK